MTRVSFGGDRERVGRSRNTQFDQTERDPEDSATEIEIEIKARSFWVAVLLKICDGSHTESRSE